MIFPQKCIKCHNTTAPLTIYNYIAKRKKKKILVPIPVCYSCRDDLISYSKYEDFYYSHKFRFLGSCIPLIFYGVFLVFFLPLFMYFMSSIYIYFIIFFLVYFISIISSIIKVLIKFIHPHRVSKFMKVDKNGQLTIKDPEYRAETLKLNTTQYEDNQNIEKTCPSCGAKYTESIDFCTSCGKDLRII